MRVEEAMRVLEAWFDTLSDRDRAWLAGALRILRQAVGREDDGRQK